MERLPAVTPRKLIAALERMGFFVHHARGSHHYLKHPDDPAIRVTVALHSNTLKRGTLRAILRQANLTVEELREYL
jgi:predicted RNA binding protein YcfA (HicA-like mRNA interferase family)